MPDKPKTRGKAIHFELHGTKPIGGITQIACNAAFRKPWIKNEITHTRSKRDVTCAACRESKKFADSIQTA